MDDATTTRPLVATADEVLLDDLLRLCAASSVTPELAHDVSSARRSWRAASLVLVGSDLAESLSRVDLPRRDGVLLVTEMRSDPRTWETAVAVRAEDVVVLPDGESRLAERIADTLDETGRRAVTVAVIGACGGAGSSYLAGALALVAGRAHLRTLLIDGDPLGGGIDLVVGGEAVQGVRWPDLAGTAGRVNAAALRGALPAVDGVAVLSWDRGDQLHIAAESMRTVLAAGRRGCDLVVVDLPRRMDDASAEALASASVVLMVVPGHVRAVAAAGRVRSQVATIVRDVWLVVRGPMSSGLTTGAIGANLDLPVAGFFTTDERVADDVESGFGPARRHRSSLRRVCTELVRALTDERSVA
jgi:secretion/DNA translocation related CpaE-like protein